MVRVNHIERRLKFKAWEICAFYMDEILNGPDFPYENMLSVIHRYERGTMEKLYLQELVIQTAMEIYKVDILLLSCRKL